MEFILLNLLYNNIRVLLGASAFFNNFFFSIIYIKISFPQSANFNKELIGVPEYST